MVSNHSAEIGSTAWDDAQDDIVDKLRIERGVSLAQFLEETDDQRDRLDGVQRFCALAPSARHANGVVVERFGRWYMNRHRLCLPGKCGESPLARDLL